MAESNVPNNSENARLTDIRPVKEDPAKLPEVVFHSVVVDLDAASHALASVADKLDNDEMYGEAGLLRLVGYQLREITRYIDEEKWDQRLM